jgi:hypothetical protein
MPTIHLKEVIKFGSGAGRKRDRKLISMIVHTADLLAIYEYLQVP